MACGGKWSFLWSAAASPRVFVLVRACRAVVGNSLRGSCVCGGVGVERGGGGEGGEDSVCKRAKRIREGLCRVGCWSGWGEGREEGEEVAWFL